MAYVTQEERIRGTFFCHNRVDKLHIDFVTKSPLRRRQVPNPKAYRTIIKLLFTKIFKEIVLEGYIFHFRHLGKFSCIKYLPKIKQKEDGTIITNKPVNFPATFKARRETGNNKLFVYFDNRETGGYTFKVLWDKTRAHFVNKNSYVLKLEKDLKKWFNEQIKLETIQANIIDVKL